MKAELNWNPVPKPKCALCGQKRDNHSAKGLHCPVGLRTRVGFIHFHSVDVYTQKKSK